MTKVAHSVITADGFLGTPYGEDLEPLILGKVFTSGHGMEQSFEQVLGRGWEEGEHDAGGSVFYVIPVYAAAFNHVPPTEIADWFEALPWGPSENASLTVHGEDGSVYVLVVDGVCWRTVSEG